MKMGKAGSKGQGPRKQMHRPQIRRLTENPTLLGVAPLPIAALPMSPPRITEPITLLKQDGLCSLCQLWRR